METLGKSLIVVAAIAGGVALVLYGDPSKAKEWGPLLTAVITAYVAYQQREQSKVLKDQNVAAAVRTDKIDDLSKQVEAVHVDVNSGATRALDTTALEAHSRGVRETIEALQPTIAAAVATERQASEEARR